MSKVTNPHGPSVVWIACSIGILWAPISFAADRGWRKWTVDPQPISGNTNSCVFLPNGDVVIGYANDTKNRTSAARFNGHEWKIDLVVSTDAKGLSMAVDGSGKIYLSSIESRSRSLRISVFDKGKWTSEIIDSGNRFTDPTSIVIGKSDEPVVFAYMLGANSLQAFVKNGKSWVPQVVAAPAGYEVSGAISSTGLVACSSMAENVARLSLLEGERWTHHRFKGLGDLKGPNALDFNGKSLPTLVVSGRGSEGLKLATFSDGKLSSEFIEKGIPSGSASLDYSADGRPVVAYIDRSDLFDGLLKVATQENGRWIIETVDSQAGGGWQTDVAWGPDGKIGVSYYDQENRTLKFALKTSPATVRSSGSKK